MMENPIVSRKEQRFAKLEEAGRTLGTMSNRQRGPCPKIQRVPAFLRERPEFTEYYTPKMISIGPIHHHLKLGEDYKLLWAASYLEGNQRAEYLHQKIEDKIRELKEMYTADTIKDYNDEDLAWMLFLDGCSVLEILGKANLMNPDHLHVKVDQLALVQLDLLLLENQLPFQVLKLLCNEDEATAVNYMDKFLNCHHFTEAKPDGAPKNSNQMTPGEEASEHKVAVPKQPPPTHLLDYLRTKFFVFDNQKTNYQSNTSKDWTWTTYRNMQELKEVGITAKRNSNSVAAQSKITFKCFIFYGTLYLSKLVVDESTAPGLLNLIAYEMCPDFQNDFAVSSYVAFLNTLIDHPNDVKELRSAGVLYNALGSDEEVAELFNIIASDVVPDTTKYAAVRDEMEIHYKRKRLRWFNQLLSTHFSTPWTIIGFIAALLAFVLTAIQTWYALPFNK